MKNTKLISALKTLNKSEWFAFRKFLLMEVKENTEVFSLFEFLQSKKENFEKLSDTKIVRENYFPDYSHKRFLNLISKLYNIFEEWLMYFQFKKEIHTGELLLLKALNEKGLYKHANSLASTIEEKIQKVNTFDLNKNKSLQLLWHTQYYSDNAIKYKMGPPILQNLINAFLASYQEQSILYLTELFNWGNIQDHDFTQSIELIKTSISCLNLSPQYHTTKELIELVAHNKVKSLQSLKNELESNCFTDGSQLKTLIYFYILTSSLRMWREGIYQDAELISEIYDYGFTSKVLLSEGKIPQRRFHNIVSTLGTIRTKDWTYKFVHKWYKQVNATFQYSNLNLALAQICFIHNDYNEIISLTRDLKFDSIEIRMRSLGLELISLYEEREEYRSLLDNTIHNFKRTLKRNKAKVTINFYNGHLNLIDFIQKMLKREYKYIDIDLLKYNNLIYRTWCSKKLETSQP